MIMGPYNYKGSREIMKNVLKLCAFVATVSFAPSSFAQNYSSLELIDTALQEVLALDRLASVAKGESKAANARRDYSLAGRLRIVSSQANGLSSAISNRFISSLFRKARIQDINRDFANFSRYDVTQINRSIDAASGNLSPDYAGAVLGFTSAQDYTAEALGLASGSAIREHGWLCFANDSGVEEHGAGHGAVAPDQQIAKDMANEQCRTLHGSCRFVRCSEYRE
jgi:hypothetical protein